MKKLLTFALMAAVAAPLFAQDEEDINLDIETDEIAVQPRESKRESKMWPACFALCEFPASPDVVGLRITIPYSTCQDNVTGVDIGLWGRSLYFQGIQLNLLRNDVKDEFSGVQVGIYNSIGSGQMFGVQVGLWNEANSIRGVQAGLVNLAGSAEGFQFGLINRSETMHGYQVGLINVIRDAELQFCPIVNIGF